MESPTPLDLIKSIHKQGPTLQRNPEPGELAKGDVPGHEFHGNQYTGGGGAQKGTEMAEMATEGDKRIWVSHTGSHVHED